MWTRVMVARVHPTASGLLTPNKTWQYHYSMFASGFLFVLGAVAALVCLAHWRTVLTLLAYGAIIVLIIVGFASVHK